MGYNGSRGCADSFRLNTSMILTNPDDMLHACAHFAVSIHAFVNDASANNKQHSGYKSKFSTSATGYFKIILLDFTEE